jgi:hypothetical protein
MADFVRKISLFDEKTPVDKKLTFTVPECLLSSLKPGDDLGTVVEQIMKNRFLSYDFLDKSLKHPVTDIDMHVYELNNRRIERKYQWEYVDVDRDYAMYYKNCLFSGCEFGYNTHRPVISADANAYWFYTDL